MAPPIYLNGIQSSIYKEKTFMIILISFSILACREDGGKEKKIWNLALLEVLRTSNGCPEITNFLLSFLCFLFPSTGTCSICISLIYCHGLISKKIFACWFSRSWQIDISCMGEKLLQWQTLRHVWDSVWLPRIIESENSTAALVGNPGGHRSTNYLMSLQYGRRCFFN